MPISKIQQRDEAVSLYDKQAIDRRELLERLDWPNINEVLKRIEAGPLGAILDKLSLAGMPPQILEFAKQMAEIDSKDLKKAMEKGEIPSFDKFMQQVMAETQGQPAPQDPAQAAEGAKVQAEVEKLKADAALSIAKAETEAVEQQVKITGMQFDDEKLKIERAKAVDAMEDSIKTHDRENFKAGTDLVTKLVGKPGEGVSGIQSDNREA